ncbi:WD repeat-containing protein JIP5-like [Henckelia pumila]|uniref:WD repeat-containing protein JIP5-like n=1 Tax=Henckelia pumila TaxID=405737 RepID=UPI003C6DEBE3
MPPKRAKVTAQASSSSSKLDGKFVSLEAQKKYDHAKLHRNPIPMHGLELSSHTSCLGLDVKARGWAKFCTQPKAVVVPVVHEFYANAAEWEDGKAFLKGKIVSFDEDMLNRFLETPPVDDMMYQALKANPDYNAIIDAFHDDEEWLQPTKTVDDSARKGKNVVTRILEEFEEGLDEGHLVVDELIRSPEPCSDGTLSVCNLRSNKVQTISEFSEDELLSVVIMKNGRKVVCGTQTGTLLLYSWGFFKDCSDRFIDLSPNSVDALLKLDEDRIITGSENGIISLVGILPNRVIQPIAEHSEYPVERLGMTFIYPFN